MGKLRGGLGPLFHERLDERRELKEPEVWATRISVTIRRISSVVMLALAFAVGVEVWGTGSEVGSSAGVSEARRMVSILF